MAETKAQLDGWRDPPDLDALKDRVLDFEKSGMLLRAYDAAIEGLDYFLNDRWLQHRAVLALARSGATETATRQYRKFGLQKETVGDAAALGARLEKDQAWQATGAKRKSHAARAAKSYAKIYRASAPEKAYFPGINAATMRLVAGDVAGATALAGTLLKKIDRLPARPSGDPDRHENYYRAATRAEALAILRDAAGAREALARAREFLPEDYSAHETTRRQIGRICDIRKLDRNLLAPLLAPRVIHYCGHMIAPAGKPGRFVAEGEKKVAADIRKYLDGNNVGFAYGSLACGADILFAEAMIRRKGELHVVLPFGDAEFRKTSVRNGGDRWARRFNRCRKAASSVTYATEDEYLGDDGLFGYCSRLAMGLAVLRARYLDAPVEQVALWDGEVTCDVAGTSADIAVWQGLGLPSTILDSPARASVRRAAPKPPARKQAGRETKAMLFGDFKDFSKLTDRQLRVFVTDIMGTVARVLDRPRHKLLFRNSWGDGLYLVFDDALAAARCAMDLQAGLSALSLSDLGLPENLSLRLGGHFGPVYRGRDPVMDRPNYFGTHVSRTARIEPQTPEGSVYVSEPFAAALALDPDREFTGDYVGAIPLAKKYGDLPVYLLRRYGG